MSEPTTAAGVLRKYQKQCDPDGIEVQVSRQALDEVLDSLEQKDSELAKLRKAYGKQFNELTRALNEIERLRGALNLVMEYDSNLIDSLRRKSQV